MPTGPEDYQAAFDYRRGGWAGADGAIPIPLPDGRTVWLFGDTFMGEIDEDDALLPGWTFINNSVQVQSGGCFTPVTGGTSDEPRSLLPMHGDAVFWPSGGYPDLSVDPPVLRVPASGVCVGGGSWRVCTMKIFTLSLPELEMLSIDPVPYEPSRRDMPGFGSSVLLDGEFVYLYGAAGAFQVGGATGRGPFPPGQYVARARADELVSSRWEYWTGSGWSRVAHRARRMSFDTPEDQRNLPPGGVVRWGEGYLRTGKSGWLWVFGTAVYAWYADGPAGPWRQVVAGGEPVNIVPEEVTFPQSRLFYGGFLVNGVPGTSPQDPMLVFSTNAIGCDAEDNDPACTPDTDAAQNVMLYGPQFVRPIGLP